MNFSPEHFPRSCTPPVIYNDFSKRWLLLSLLPGRLCAHIHCLSHLVVQFWDLILSLGCFLLEYRAFPSTPTKKVKLQHIRGLSVFRPFYKPRKRSVPYRVAISLMAVLWHVSEGISMLHVWLNFLYETQVIRVICISTPLQASTNGFTLLMPRSHVSKS